MPQKVTDLQMHLADQGIGGGKAMVMVMGRWDGEGGMEEGCWMDA